VVVDLASGNREGYVGKEGAACTAAKAILPVDDEEQNGASIAQSGPMLSESVKPKTFFAVCNETNF
jgi:hypothetical protein